jgi:thymidine phosphorylase
MLELAGIKGSDPAAALKNGKAMDVWRQMISAQGGDPDAKLPVAKENTVVTAQASGTILSMDAMKVGMAAWRLGAGRSRQGEKVQAGAGIEIHAKPGDSITAGAPLYTLHTDTPAAFTRALESLEGSVVIGDMPATGIDRLPLVLERITD